MSLWLQNPGKLYLPPPKPVAKIYNTDEYVKRTGYYFHVGTERLLLVGNPYFDVEDNNNNITTPKVSANQYRVLKLQLPDPNKFAIADKCVYNPETERLVWKLTGIEIGRGGPLGIGATGHPLFNKFIDVENPSDYPGSHTDENDYRKDIAFEPKQVQMFIVGCVPPTGQYWEVTKPCNKLNKGDCPAIELLHTYIQDGDMCEIGFGNANFQTFQEDKAGVPLEITNEICLWPDFLKMTKDVYGDQAFFFNKKEQLYGSSDFGGSTSAGHFIAFELRYRYVSCNPSGAGGTKFNSQFSSILGFITLICAKISGSKGTLHSSTINSNSYSSVCLV